MEAVTVRDLMQSGYTYLRTEPMGKNFDPRFTPDLTPKEMLTLGVFGGKYMTDCKEEFPEDWFTEAKLSPKAADHKLNYFGVKASQSRGEWIRHGWIHPDDPRGWFQWYCRYYSGRRMPEEDDRQIKRWIGIRRHLAQVRNNCRPHDYACRTRQRQAVLHWAYDSRKI